MLELLPYLSLSINLLAIIVVPYLIKKGQNYATKEDVGEITHKVEEVKKEFTKEIEGFKSTLDKGNIEYQIRYTKLLELRSEAISVLFSKLEKMQKTLIYLQHEHTPANSSLTKEQEEKIAEENAEDFINYYNEKIILFDKETNNLIKKMIDSYWDLRGNYFYFQMIGPGLKEGIEERKPYFEKKKESWQKIHDEIPALKRELIDKFKRLYDVD